MRGSRGWGLLRAMGGKAGKKAEAAGAGGGRGGGWGKWAVAAVAVGAAAAGLGPAGLLGSGGAGAGAGAAGEAPAVRGAPYDFSPYNPRGVDYAAVREEISGLIKADKVAGTEMVRLAFHLSGTFTGTGTKSQAINSDGKRPGGSWGGTIRFPAEYERYENIGINDTIALLQPIRDKHAASGLQYGDLYTLAGVVAVEELGGPKVAWRAGRKDLPEDEVPATGRLLDANIVEMVLNKVVGIHKEVVFNLGFNEREMIALFGARTIGGAWVKDFRRETKAWEGWIPRNGPWTANPTVFDNSYYKNLMDKNLIYKDMKLNSPLYGIEKGTFVWIEKENMDDPEDHVPQILIMLQSDFGYRPGKSTSLKLGTKIFKEFAEDQDKWFSVFSSAFSKFLELGCDPEALVEV